MGWLRSAWAKARGSAGLGAPGASSAPGPDWRALGNAALDEGDLAEAVRCYANGIDAGPRDASLRLNLGYALLEQGHPALASQRLMEAIGLRMPDEDILHDAHFLLGRAQQALSQPEQALASFEAAVRAKPDFVEALQEAVRTSLQLQKVPQAVQWARRLDASSPSTFSRLLLAMALAAAHEDEEAAPLLDDVLAQEPGRVDAALLRLQVLFRLRRFDDAVAQAESLLRQVGRDAGLLASLAGALEKTNRLDEALAAADEALRLEPRRRDALFNRVVILLAQARLQEGIAAARSALQFHPDDADLHWMLGTALLQRGEFREGWQEHEWRTRSAAFTGWRARVGDIEWRGEDLAGKTLLLYGEQGFGDALQFVRYVPMLAERAAQVLLAVPRELEPLMQDVAANCRIVPHGSAVPPFDRHAALMSLPGLLGTTVDGIPAAVPYLHAAPDAVTTWRARTAARGLRIGIAWSGRATHPNDRNRSMTLRQMQTLACDGCSFFTIQPQLGAEDRTLLESWPGADDSGRGLRDFADTAALVESLDLVISVDTSVVHLAGALGRPVWVLLALPADWRWMLQGESSPWYPTARLYRQGPDRDWEPVLQRMKSDLAEFAAHSR